MNIKKIIIISSLSLIVLISAVYLLLFKEEKLEDISIQVANVREMKDYDLTTMGDRVEDNIYEKYDTVKFGKYYQDKSGLNKTSIDWIVLEKKEDKVLLLSKYILDSKPIKLYTEEELELYRGKIRVYTWGTSTLRKWLNEEFYKVVFNSGEKDRILLSDLENEYEDNTKDKVFLLSEKEFRKYFENGLYYEKLNDPDYDNPLKERIGYSYEDAIEMQAYVNAQTVGTDYAFSKGLIDLRNGWKDPEPDSNSFWGGDIEPEYTQSYWLRTPTFLGSGDCCRVDGASYFLGIDQTTPANYHGYGVRPAIWVSLKD